MTKPRIANSIALIKNIKIAKSFFFKLFLKLKLVVNKIILFFIENLAEVEASLSEPNSPIYIRRLYLQIRRVKYGNKIFIGKNFILFRSDNLILGERCALGHCVIISNHGKIEIGDDFIGATGLHINSGTHNPKTLKPQCLPIVIGNRVWCGIDVKILAGVTIGDDVVIGAGSVVCKDIPSNSIAVGVPAKVIKPLNRDSETSIWTWVDK